MAFTVSFGNSGSGAVANWGLVLLVLAIFLYFTGMWRMVSDRWNQFFGSSLWNQTISNVKATWNQAPAQTRQVAAPPPAPFA